MFEMQEEIEKSRHGKMEKLGKYIQEYTVKNKCAESIPVYSVTNTQGFCKDYFGKEVASKDKTTYKIVPKGYFAYNPSRINVGSVDWQRNEERVIVSPLYNVFSVSEQLNQQYLYYYLKSDIVRQFIKAIARGTVRDNLKLSMLCEFPIYVPSVLEQENIVVKLDGLQKVINLRKQQLQKLDELIQARFVEMFGGLHNSKLYPYVSIETFTDVTSGGTPNRNTKEYWENGNIRWVKTTELHNNFITDTEEYITRKGIDNSSAKVIPAHSILVAMYGQGKTRGMTGYLLKECTTNQACACILPCKRVDQKYLWYYMILSYDKLRGMAKGGKQPNLNIGIIKRFQVLVPPIELQSQFADFVNQVNKSKLVIKNLLQIYKHQIQM